MAHQRLFAPRATALAGLGSVETRCPERVSLKRLLRKHSALPLGPLGFPGDGEASRRRTKSP